VNCSTFMVYDGIIINGKDIRHLGFLDRLREAEVATKGPKFQIKLIMKTMWPLAAVEQVWNASYPYEIDGLVFTPVDEPIRMETHETMFKWKPKNLITVDFKVHEGWLCIWDRGEYIKVQRSDYADGKILECKFVDPDWVTVKIREDKNMPNNRRTMIRTMVNLVEDIQVPEFKIVDSSNGDV